MTEVAYDRNNVYIKGRAVLHTTACRDWVCGECGSKLTNRWFDNAPNWRTICAGDPLHHPDEFVHGMTWEHLEHERSMEALTAQHVFDNLPDDLQAAIVAAE